MTARFQSSLMHTPQKVSQWWHFLESWPSEDKNLHSNNFYVFICFI